MSPPDINARPPARRSTRGQKADPTKISTSLPLPADDLRRLTAYAEHLEAVSRAIRRHIAELEQREAA